MKIFTWVLVIAAAVAAGMLYVAFQGQPAFINSVANKLQGSTTPSAQ